MKRYAVTVDFYIHVENDKEAKEKAEMVVKNLSSRSDNKASVVSIHDAPFGKIADLREVK